MGAVQGRRPGQQRVAGCPTQSPPPPNRLTELPATIARVAALRTVYLDGNRLSALPPHRPGCPELVQICHIHERDGRRAGRPDGLMHRLIVPFHRFSLGRDDVAAAVHWSGGVVLQDRYGDRALMTWNRGELTLRVRGLNPQAFLDRLVQEVREYVEGYWRGLATRVVVPCAAVCSLTPPGHGRFDLDKLYRRLEAGKRDCTCPDPDCDADVDVEALLRGLGPSADRAGPVTASVRDAVEGILETHYARLRAAQDGSRRQVLARLDRLDDASRTAFSRVDQQIAGLLRSLDDDAADGPRLFGLEPLERTLRHPGVRTWRMRLTLWCEHSRVPVHLLEPGRSDAGVYDIEVPNWWWLKMRPYLRATSLLLKAALPVGLAAVQLDLTDQQWNAVSEQLALGKEALDAAVDLAGDGYGPGGGQPPAPAARTAARAGRDARGPAARARPARALPVGAQELRAPLPAAAARHPAANGQRLTGRGRAAPPPPEPPRSRRRLPGARPHCGRKPWSPPVRVIQNGDLRLPDALATALTVPLDHAGGDGTTPSPVR